MKNYVKIILIVVLVLLVVFIADTVRKIMIFETLEDKAIALNTRENIYRKEEHDYFISEEFKKDNQIKLKTTNKETGKTEISYREVKEDDEVVPNYVKHLTFFERIKSGVTASIKTEKIGEASFYVISDMNNINWAIPDGCKDMRMYIEKDTGLLMKCVREYEDKEEISIFNYSFGTVTDEDMQSPRAKDFLSKVL